MENSLVVLLL